MATMRKCAWFACLFSVVCISEIVAPMPKVDATFPFPPISIPFPFPLPFTPPRSPPPPPPRSPPPPPPRSPPPPPLLQAPPLPSVNLETFVNVNGTIFCTINGTSGANGSATPVFPNATVQLRCGGNTVAAVITNATGGFTLIVPITQAAVLDNCNLVVPTPLSNCNATLPNTTIITPPLGLPNTTIQTVNVVTFPNNPFSR